MSVLSMNLLLSLLVLYLPLVLIQVEAQTNLDDGNSQDAVSNFQPSLVLVIGVLCLMFSLTFILLIYARFCRRPASVRSNSQIRPGLIRSSSRFSGIDKTVIESLPFFRFSSLRGSKEGLECAVCLSRFEDTEILRFLPQCKHAFHINCIDQWLEKHSSCPLCRSQINANDPAIFTYSDSMRFLWNQSEPREESNIEIFVEREESRQGSSRYSIGSSFRKIKKGDKEEASLIQEVGDDEEVCSEYQKVLCKFNHKIVVSDVVFKNRWSNVSSSDLLFLKSEMLNDLSSNRFNYLDSENGKFTITRGIEYEQVMKIKEEMEMKRLFESKIGIINNSVPSSIPGLPSTSNSEDNSSQTGIISNLVDRRSVSEITAFSRFRNLSIKNAIRESFSGEGSNVKEERIRQLWFPIAKKTVQWFANRESRSQEENQRGRQTLDV